MADMTAAEVESAFNQFEQNFTLDIWDHMAEQCKATIEAFEVSFDTVCGTKLVDYDKNIVKSAIDMAKASLEAMHPAPAEIRVGVGSITAHWIFPNRIPIPTVHAYRWLQEFILHKFLPTNSVCWPISNDVEDIRLYQALEKPNDYNIFLAQFSRYCRTK